MESKGYRKVTTKEETKGAASSKRESGSLHFYLPHKFAKNYEALKSLLEGYLALAEPTVKHCI